MLSSMHSGTGRDRRQSSKSLCLYVFIGSLCMCTVHMFYNSWAVAYCDSMWLPEYHMASTSCCTCNVH